MSAFAPYQEVTKNELSKKTSKHYQEWLEAAKKFREADANAPRVVAAADQPWEMSPQGKLRHLINEQMGTREYACDMYIQELAPGSRSGKHYHASEEIVFVLEGAGYDLHWDPQPRIEERYYWEWKKNELKLPWEAGYFVYIPPIVQHQHFNASATDRARILSSTCRALRPLGQYFLAQVENCPEWK